MMQSNRFFLLLTATTIILALIVIVLGAYTRLSHAGLGCPDWPGCYGKMIVPDGDADIDQVNRLYPDRPLEHGKAWKEMIHRYAAGALGLMILAMALFAIKNRHTPGQPFWAPVGLLGLVIFQAILGMWTVTLLLKPIVVMGHLLGGMTILLLLSWQLLSYMYAGKSMPGSQSDRLYPWAILALIIIYMQISLGGWTSANYAALVCPDLPVCQGEWWPAMDFAEAYVPWRGLGVDYEFGVLNTEARTAIHVSHRIGAILTVIIVGTIAIAALTGSNSRARVAAAAILFLLVLQFGLGVANVLYIIPITIAVAHNGVASLLLIAIGSLVFFTKNPQIKHQQH